ncbi:Oxoglutarate and iron-dependent oxygenase degradation C-term-domain-containing protein [Radiomyces spectabilis]|uniref:Oxoglutarate and iron-dependent oxygenase degradation C-term-domain-containing protein n=1 Tax=Radiomyces spectabilis TaxID=64574 RepID=UPI00221FAA4B|nr:Oxoglutarate and iron-dependent oxygenase degradation C-term-domain-containing protein [Radiomyces spectabilis]KAI8368312.1 Oxoglutarate and iron-dependent oxygenase degradation C-term-domain-containing protein [Radiomyces spectabilis]
MTTEERATKRTKIDSVKSKFQEDLLESSNVERLSKAFKESKPYLHCKIDKLVTDDLLRKVRKEIFDNLHFTVKETDIYKVHQTGDLANLDGLPSHELAQLSSLFELRNAIYSEEFRNFISSVMGCGPLSGSKMDMSINNYKEGCHLLNHDDVIGSRRVSYILYLTDPDKAWNPKFGGALELYPVIEKGIPATEPTVVIPPQWNQFVMFTVQPGHSFHSVEEVVPEGEPRLSISGWFHRPQVGEPGYSEKKDAVDEAKSSLEQLQEESDSHAKFAEYSTTLDDDATEGLTESDLLALAEWMNPHYLDMTIMSQMSDRFLDESAVQCKEIINKDLFAKLQAATTEADKRDHFTTQTMATHGTGVGGQWTAHGPPHRCRYLTVDASKDNGDETSSLFLDLQKKFESESFRRWLAVVTQCIPNGYRGEARRFRPGHDYTLATTNTRGQGVLDVTLCIANTPDKISASHWESGEYGGYECYMAPHNEEEDAAVYRAADDDGALLTLAAGCNELSIVLRDEGVMRFIKYVSARAPGSRWDVSYEYDLPEEDEEDNDDEEEEEDKDNK